MSGSVDDEVVRMRFDNNAFERGVANTLGTLAKLKASLTFSGAGKGLDDVQAKTNKFSMGSVNKAVDDSGYHWSAWRSAGLIAFATLTHQAVLAGERIVSSFTIDPIKDGFQSYETQINAAKIIISNTGAKLPQVEQQLAQLQTYANQTVYSFSDMAKNIGTFTAAGVKLVPAVSAIKGMGNSAALSGANVEQLNSAMYQMSQAMSSGVIRLQDWNSLSNANMGGQNIQKALMSTAETIKGTGPKMDAAIKKYGNFRQSLTAGWLTADVFSKAMGVMAGTVDKTTGKTRAFSVAELQAQGYTKAHAIELNRLSQAAIESATQIRTYTQLTQALKEEVGTAYGAIFKTLFGNLDAATTMFTKIHNVAENALTNPIYALNNLLQAAFKLGARAKLVDAFTNAIHAMHNIMATIKTAWRDVFPAYTAQRLSDLITRFDNFTKRLKMGEETTYHLRRTFAGVFALLDIGKQVVQGIFHVFGMLFKTVAGGGGSFLGFTAHIGDMIVAFDQALKKGGLIANFFQIIGNLISIPIHLFGTFAAVVAGLFRGFHVHDANSMTNSVTGAGNALARVAVITQHLSDWFAGLTQRIRPGIQAVVNGMHAIGAAIGRAFSSTAFSNILGALQTGLLGGIVLLLNKFLKNGLNVDIGHGFLGTLKETLEGVTGSLRAMQTQLKAKALMEIAIAMGILTASIVALAFLDPKKIQSSLTALAVGFGELMGALAILNKIGGSAIKLPVIAASLILISTAILILTAAVAAMSLLSWQQIEKGLTVIGALLLGISIATYALSANSTGLIAASIGITAIAVAMNLLYFAVKDFGSLSWTVMLHGLEGIGIALAGIAIAMRLMPKGMVLQAAALLLISAALNALYLAVKNFATMSWTEMGKGLAGVAGSLVAIALAMKLMPPGMVLQAVALNLIALALQGIDKAVADMSKLSWSQLLKGLAGLAGALLVLAGGLFLMQGSLGGAAALLVVSAALRIFVPVLQALGTMSWSTIGKGLLALAASFAVIGVAGLLLTPVIPSLLALGVALGLVGLAMLAFGAGASLLGIGLTAIAASGGAAIGVLLSGLKGFLLLLPVAATSIATALVNFIVIIGQNAPAIVGAFVSLITQLLNAIPTIMPSLITAFNSIITTLLSVITTNVPLIIAAGFNVLMSFLSGIANNIGQVVTAVVNIIVNFLNALASNIGRIVDAGFNLLVKFLEGIASALGHTPGAVLQIIGVFLSALFGNFGKIVSAGVSLLGKLISGIVGAVGRMVGAAVSAVGSFLGGIGGQAGKIASKGAEVLGHFIHGIIDKIAGWAGELASRGYQIIQHIVDGIMNGIGSLAGKVASGIGNMVSGALGTAGKILHIGGPSQVFHDIGAQGIGQGLINGIEAMHGKVSDATATLGKKSILEMQKTVAGLGQAISDTNLEYRPTVTPILDLGQFSKDADQMSTMITPPLVTATVSTDQAANISNLQAAAAREAAASTPAAGSATPSVSLTQNNYSPKALSTVDIYRQTKNQLAQAKAIAGVPTSPTLS